jgi:hypothetical protein
MLAIRIAINFFMISSSWKVDIDQVVICFNVQRMLWLTAVRECNVLTSGCPWSVGKAQHDLQTRRRSQRKTGQEAGSFLGYSATVQVGA